MLTLASNSARTMSTFPKVVAIRRGVSVLPWFSDSRSNPVQGLGFGVGVSGLQQGAAYSSLRPAHNLMKSLEHSRKNP